VFPRVDQQVALLVEVDALMWNQSHGVLADAGSGCSLWP